MLVLQTPKDVRIGLLHLGACGKPSRPCRFGSRCKRWGHQLQSVTSLFIPPAVPSAVPSGFSNLAWKLHEIHRVTGKALKQLLQSPTALSPCNVYGALLVWSRGGWPEPRFILLVSAPKRSKWGFCFFAPPRCFPVPSSSTDFFWGSRWHLNLL